MTSIKAEDVERLVVEDENDELPALEKFTAYVKERGWNTAHTTIPEFATYVRFHDEEVDKMWLWFSTGWQLSRTALEGKK